MQTERLGWTEFLDTFTWAQGDHVTLVGPTKSGKTTLLQRILDRRRYVVMFGTKAKDPTLDRFAREAGFRTVRDWPPPRTITRAEPYRCVLWPVVKNGTARQLKAKQVEVFGRTLEDVYKRGGFCIAADELHVLEKLGLVDLLEYCYEQGRSNNITMVSGTQRPRHVTLDAWSQATHFFLWKTPDLGDRKRLAEISGQVDPKAIGLELGTLGRHEVLYVDAPNGRMVRTEVEL